MNEKGYGVMSIKKEVIEEIKTKAKEEKMTISDLLSNLLKQPYSNKEEKGYSNDIATEIKELKEALYSNSIATDKECNCVTKEDLKSDIGMFIENGIAKGIKELKTF